MSERNERVSDERLAELIADHEKSEIIAGYSFWLAMDQDVYAALTELQQRRERDKVCDDSGCPLAGINHSSHDYSTPRLMNPSHACPSCGRTKPQCDTIRRSIVPHACCENCTHRRHHD